MPRQFISTVRELIKMLGGVTVTARMLGHKHVTTVQAWSTKNQVPTWRRGEIEIALRRENIFVSTSELDAVFNHRKAA